MATLRLEQRDEALRQRDRAEGRLARDSPTASSSPCSVRRGPGRPRCCGRSSVSRGRTSGDVYADDERITDVYPGDRDIAIMFQNLALYPDKTVFGNLAFPLKQRKLPKSGDPRSASQKTAAVLHVEHLLERKPGKLSGGERQRVALGRALVRDPRAFLFDEPLSALDALLRLEMRAELKRLQRDLGRTLVYVTHDQVEAMSMPDRVAVLREGVVQQVDTPENVYHRPANRFVATVVGSPPMNFIPCTVGPRNGGLQLKHDLFEVRAADARADSGREAGRGQRLPARRPA